MNSVTKVRTPLFPTYSEVRKLLPILAGTSKVALLGMWNAITDQTGTPQSPVDWSDPDTWIRERLEGEDAALANRIWQASERTVNPRHFYGSYLFINGFDLLVPDPEGAYQITERGRAFLSGNPVVVREIDELEGLPNLLAILATKPQAQRSDLIEEWGEFLKEHSNYGTPSTIKDTLRRRLLNLVGRGFVEREGNTYHITPRGLEYASDSAPKLHDPKREVMHAIRAFNTKAQNELRDLLSRIKPYAFEHLMRDLLEAMGYDDVVVTKQSGDKGVDVVAKVQFGITTITEVVQVKRTQSSIQRPVLDQLRGVLPFHGAIRGTIITLGKFSRGCEDVATFTGAAPITLIDGDKLIELLVEHEIGLHKRPVTLYEVDLAIFDGGEVAKTSEASQGILSRTLS